MYRNIWVKIIKNTYLVYNAEVCCKCGDHFPSAVTSYYCMVFDINFEFKPEPIFKFNYALDFEYNYQNQQFFCQIQEGGRIYLPADTIAVKFLDLPVIKSSDCQFKDIKVINNEIYGVLTFVFNVELCRKEIISIKDICML